MDPRSGRKMRHHVLESGSQKAVRRAEEQAGIDKKSVATLRHSFATHMPGILELRGHANVKTTEIYIHVMSKDIRKLQSLLDMLPQ